MRIRKHAARILSSLSIPTQSFVAAATAVTVGCEVETHVCELNQSPWDVMTFTPPEAVPLHHYQEVEGVPEEEKDFVAGAKWSKQREEDPAAATVSDVSGIYSTQPTLRRQVIKTKETTAGAKGKKQREHKIEAKKQNTNHNTKKIKRKTTSSCPVEIIVKDERVKMEVEPAVSGAAVTTCKKSDGKGWHCKRAAQRPHSLCEYHLTQVRSYYSNGGGSTAYLLQQQEQQQCFRKMHGGIVDTKQNAPLVHAKKDINKKKNKTTTKKGSSGNGNRSSVSSNVDAASRARGKPSAPSDFYYYYYSGFGPWWAKRRSGGGLGKGLDQEVSDVDTSNGDDDGAGTCDGASPPRVHDQGPDDLDDDDDLGHLGDLDRDDVVPGKRRVRKPIKARSLKSLL